MSNGESLRQQNTLTATDQVLAGADQDFYNDVRTEMKKVTAPSLKEVQATTVVVIITVFLFAAYFWAVDLVIGRGIDSVFRYFEQH